MTHCQEIEQRDEKLIAKARKEGRSIFQKYIVGITNPEKNPKAKKRFMEEAYPVDDFTPEEIGEIKELLHEVEGHKRKRKEYEQVTEEVNQLAKLQFVKATDTKPAHFKGQIKEGKVWKKSPTSKINLEWVRHFFKPSFWGMLMNTPGTWLDIPLGAPNKHKAPNNLQTSVVCLYQQMEKEFCLVYSLASALYYIGMNDAAAKIAKIMDLTESSSAYDAIQTVNVYMKDYVPCIGHNESFGRFGEKIRHVITIQELCSKKTVYPTVVVPLGKDGSCNHAVCVVDDLVF